MQSKTLAVDQKRSFIETARRAQIIECAIETIAEAGYAQTSLARIAKRAGISAGVISYYFDGKDDLIAEVAARVFAAGDDFIRPRVEQGQNAAAALRLFIEASVGYIAAHPAYLIAVMNIMRAGRTESGALRYDPALGQARRDGIAGILGWGQGTGAFRPFSIPVMTATVIEALDAIPPELAVDPALDLPAYAAELAELFDRATRVDAKEQVR
ncbi:MAG: TetR/AcrR family transcriptional regulator [Caulobacteraceae bacterium]|nr:TetR/AcrR family transcriptional regulator [Caulobacteraceae bacterium]